VSEKEDDKIGWKHVFYPVVVIAITGLTASHINLREEIAAIKASREATIKAYADRITALENGTNTATSKRYTSDDAARENARLDGRIDRLEEIQRGHEYEDLRKFRSMGK
jgi:hypothetical protein